MMQVHRNHFLRPHPQCFIDRQIIIVPTVNEFPFGEPVHREYRIG